MEQRRFGYNGRKGAVILVHKGWRHTRKNDTVHQGLESQSRGKESAFPASAKIENADVPTTQCLNFITEYKTRKHGKTDQHALMGAKAPVGKDVKNKRKLKNYQQTNKTSPSVTNKCLRRRYENTCEALSVSQAIPEQPSTALTSYPVDCMTPTIYSLLDRYLSGSRTLLWPTEAPLINPMKAEWVQFAMSDEALFHGFLYASTVSFGLQHRVTESLRADEQLAQTFRVVNARLTGEILKVSDETMGALACLALGEALRGQISNWNIHMGGLKEIVQSRGGISKLGRTVRFKIIRADVTGATMYMKLPHLSMEVPSQSIISSDREDVDYLPTENIISTLASLNFDPQLTTLFRDLWFFSQQLASILKLSATSPDLEPFVIETYLLQSRLLSLPNNHGPTERACQIAALIYTKGIFDEFPFCGQFLAQSLRDVLLKDRLMIISSPGLLLWVLFMGCISSRQCPERAWFIAQLCKLAAAETITCWDQAKKRLEKVLWIEWVYEGIGKIKWEEVEFTSSVLLANDDDEIFR